MKSRFYSLTVYFQLPCGTALTSLGYCRGEAYLDLKAQRRKHFLSQRGLGGRALPTSATCSSAGNEPEVDEESCPLPNHSHLSSNSPVSTQATAIREGFPASTPKENAQQQFSIPVSLPVSQHTSVHSQAPHQQHFLPVLQSQPANGIYSYGSSADEHYVYQYHTVHRASEQVPTRTEDPAYSHSDCQRCASSHFGPTMTPSESSIDSVRSMHPACKPNSIYGHSLQSPCPTNMPHTAHAFSSTASLSGPASFSATIPQALGFSFLDELDALPSASLPSPCDRERSQLPSDLRVTTHGLSFPLTNSDLLPSAVASDPLPFGVQYDAQPQPFDFVTASSQPGLWF